MASFDDLLAKAEAAPKPHRDVDIYLDSDAAIRIEELEQQIAAIEPDKRLGDTREKDLRDQITAIEAEAAESLIVLRFEKMLAEDWSEIVARAPMRFDAPADRLYGFNVQQASREAVLQSGRRVDGDTVVPLTEEQWDRLLALIAGVEFTRIVDAIFDLNVYSPAQRIADAKKASSAGIDTTSS